MGLLRRNVQSLWKESYRNRKLMKEENPVENLTRGQKQEVYQRRQYE